MLNFSKPSNELVFDLINLANPDLPAYINAQNCIVEKVTQVPVNAASNNRNTTARIRGVQGSGFRDQITVFYDRIDLRRLFPWGQYINSTVRDAAAFTNFTAPNIHAALSTINETYGINLGTMDVANSGLAGISSPNYVSTVTLGAQVASPAYINSVVITYKRGLPVLDTSIVTDSLNTMNQPVDPALNQKCVDMLTYGIDFTAYRNLLTVNAGGLPQWDGLRKVLDDLGIPAYPAPDSNTVQDVPTTGLATANKAYDRVVVQTGIDAAGVKGRAYYHYNS